MPIYTQLESHNKRPVGVEHNSGVYNRPTIGVFALASIWFEATSIPFTLHANFPGSGSKVDQFDPHMVGGLK